MNWTRFKETAPEIAKAAEKAFADVGVILLGTIRKDGSPRISPVEFSFLEGELCFGGMWHSFKALDLLRDPRCILHNSLKDKHASKGEVKLHGRAVNLVPDKNARLRWAEAIRKDSGMDLRGRKYHLFSFDVESAGVFRAEKDARLLKIWRAGEPVVERRQTMEDSAPPE
jgi:hypothetical protein